MAHGMDVSTLNSFNSTSALLNSMSSGKNGSSLGWISGASDLKMIQSGVYKRALQGVYDKMSSDEVKESVKNTISDNDFDTEKNSEAEKSLTGLGNSFEALF